jgi:hypothetical protein
MKRFLLNMLTVFLLGLICVKFAGFAFADEAPLVAYCIDNHCAYQVIYDPNNPVPPTNAGCAPGDPPKDTPNADPCDRAPGAPVSDCTCKANPAWGSPDPHNPNQTINQYCICMAIP